MKYKNAKKSIDDEMERLEQVYLPKIQLYKSTGQEQIVLRKFQGELSAIENKLKTLEVSSSFPKSDANSWC